jgi:hypothetical protein
MSSAGKKGICRFTPRFKVCKIQAGFTQEKREVVMYIDPNTGGMLFQVLAAAFVAVSGVVLVFGSKIRQSIASLRRRMRKDKDEDSE